MLHPLIVIHYSLLGTCPPRYAISTDLILNFNPFQTRPETRPTLLTLLPASFQALARKLKFLSDSTFIAPLPSSANQTWKGLPRYRARESGDDGPGKNEPTESEREYAKVTTVLDAPEIDLTYYSDVAGEDPSCIFPNQHVFLSLISLLLLSWLRCMVHSWMHGDLTY